MNIVEKSSISVTEAGDLDRFRLRRFIEALPADELEVRSGTTDLADVAQALEGNPRAVLFEAAGPERQQLAGSVTGSRSRIARAFGVAPNELLREIQRRMRNKPEIVEVSRTEAPAQQVVLTGADADLTVLPVHLQHGADGAPYISSSTDFVVDPKTGFTNVGIRRLMLRGRTEAGVDLNSPSDLRAIYEASAAAGKPVPVAFVVGSHPIDHLAAVMRLPSDDLALMSSLRGAPLPVVKCVTNDVRVPADAEWVLEGYIDARGHVEPEGPYGEFLGYYGAVKRNPVFHLTAITRRRDALFQTFFSVPAPGLNYRYWHPDGTTWGTGDRQVDCVVLDPEALPSPLDFTAYKPMYDLPVGTCFVLPPEETRDSLGLDDKVQSVDCASQYNGQVFYTGTSPSAGGYPGDGALDSQTLDSCLASFQSFVGIDAQSSAVGDFLYWFASEAGWGAGDYRIACAVVVDEGRTGSTQNTKA